MAKKQGPAKAVKKAAKAMGARGPRRFVSMALRLLTEAASEAAEHAAQPAAAAVNPVALSAAASPAAAAPAVAAKPVVFFCSNPNCVVGMTAGTLNIVFVGTGGATMPVGSFPMFWRVQGTGAFTVTVQGATLSSPINSTAPDAGIRTLTVPA